MTPGLDKKPRERTSRKGTMNRRNLTAGKETSYGTGEIIHSQQDLTTAVFITSHVTLIQQVQVQCWITLTFDLLNLLHLER